MSENQKLGSFVYQVAGKLSKITFVVVLCISVSELQCGTTGTGAMPCPTPRAHRTPPAVSGQWTLISVTVVPETPLQGWCCSAQSYSAGYPVNDVEEQLPLIDRHLELVV